MEKYPKRIIEVDLPIRRISEHARREKSIRHGHISTLHIWWARRPLAACRAVLCASLWPDPADELCPEKFRMAAKDMMKKWVDNHIILLSPESQKHFIQYQKQPQKLNDNVELRNALLDFIADFANWDNSTNVDFLETSRYLTQIAHESLGGTSETHPTVIDSFAGGGSIPLEALRIGANTFASDLNPIPVLLNKVMLEYIPKYGERLSKELVKWGELIIKEAEKELSKYYPNDPDGSKPVAYLWARTIRCEGPGCGAEVPLIRSPILAAKGKKSICLIVKGDNQSKKIVVDISSKPETKPEPTVRRGSVICPVCGFTTNASNSRKQFHLREGGTKDARLLAVITVSEKTSGKNYRLPTEKDVHAFADVLTKWNELKHKIGPHGLPLIPNETLPYLRSIFNINLLGVNEWGKLHTPRQAVFLAIFAEKIHLLWDKLKDMPDGIGAAIHLCLGLALDRSADRMTSLCRWIAQTEAVGYTFGRQALGIVWDYIEINPLTTESAWLGAIENICDVISTISDANLSIGNVQECSATAHPLPDNSVTCFITDPPYYDAVPYADLSDFFYVWLKRTIASSHGRFAKDILTPKENEAVQLSERNPSYAYKTREKFESLMTDAMREGRRVLTPDGIGIVVFAHKTTTGWETQLKAMIDAGWVITGSWPIDTEKPGRLRAIDAAALASSIHLVCRPRKNVSRDSVGDYRDVLSELPKRIHEWMPRLANEGVVGADAIFACLGPALEIFSRYPRVEKANGDIVTLKEYMEHIWAAVSKEALNTIIADSDSSGLEEDARLTVMWLWTLQSSKSSSDGENDEIEQEDIEEDEEKPKKAILTGGFKLEFDAARKIAQGLGAHLEELKSLVEIKGDQACLISVADRSNYLFGRQKDEVTQPKKKKKETQLSLFFDELQNDATNNMIEEIGKYQTGKTTLDRIHQAMVLFATGRGEALKRLIVEEGVGRDARFWKLSQALSALYPGSSEEKRWIDGVLAKKKGFGF